MQQTSTEEVKELPFYDRMSIEGSWRLRGLRSFVGCRKKNLESLRMKESDETVEVQGVLGVFRMFSEAQTTAEDDR